MKGTGLILMDSKLKRFHEKGIKSNPVLWIRIMKIQAADRASMHGDGMFWNLVL